MHDKTQWPKTHHALLAICLSALLAAPFVHAQDEVSCLTSVTGGTSPVGINPAPSVGAVSGYGLTNWYTVSWCACLTSLQSYSVSGDGQASIGQDCSEASACQGVTTDSSETDCAPTFGEPTATADSWSVAVTPYTVNASTQYCVDGEEGEPGFCASNYWEVLGCVPQSPVIHVFDNASGGACRCAVNSDCDANPNGNICSSGTCVSTCTTDSDCDGNPNGGTCLCDGSCGNLGTIGSSCTCANDCSGFEDCISDSCGCDTACDDTSCPGYDFCTCNPNGAGCCTDPCNPSCTAIYNPSECSGGCNPDEDPCCGVVDDDPCDYCYGKS